MECEPGDARSLACLPPTGREAVRRPWLPARVAKDRWRASRGRSERTLNLDGCRYHYSPTCLALAEPKYGAVVGIPAKCEEVPQTLTSPERQQESEAEFLSGRSIESSDIFISPNALSPICPIEPASAFCNIAGEEPSVLTERQNTGEGGPIQL